MADETTDPAMTEDAFELAFAAAATEVSGGSETDETIKTPDASDPPAYPEVQEAETKAAEEAKAAEAKAAEEARASAEAEKAQAAEAKRQEQESKARAKAEEAEAKRKADEDKLAVERSKLEAFSEDEEKALKATKENFTEVSVALEAHSRVIMAKLESMIEQRLKALESTFGEKFGKVEKVAEAYAGDKFMSAVAAKHSDAIEVLPKVEDWIKTQPAMLQRAYNAVLDKGTVEETIELLDAFKAATVSSEDAKVAEEKAAKAAEEKKKKEEKLKAQEGVRGRSTVKRAEIDPDDFEGAFNKFAATA